MPNQKDKFIDFLIGCVVLFAEVKGKLKQIEIDPEKESDQQAIPADTLIWMSFRKEAGEFVGRSDRVCAQFKATYEARNKGKSYHFCWANEFAEDILDKSTLPTAQRKAHVELVEELRAPAKPEKPTEKAK